jgi:hypothetical protein
MNRLRISSGVRSFTREEGIRVRMQPPDEQAHAELDGCHIQASSAATVPHFEVQGEANSSTIFYQEAPEKREDIQQVTRIFACICVIFISRD